MDNSMSTQFIHAFVETCMDAGLTKEATAALLQKESTDIARHANPAFAEGFDKVASEHSEQMRVMLSTQDIDPLWLQKEAFAFQALSGLGRGIGGLLKGLGHGGRNAYRAAGSAAKAAPKVKPGTGAAAEVAGHAVGDMIGYAGGKLTKAPAAVYNKVVSPAVSNTFKGISKLDKRQWKNIANVGSTGALGAGGYALYKNDDWDVDPVDKSFYGGDKELSDEAMMNLNRDVYGSHKERSAIQKRIDANESSYGDRRKLRELNKAMDEAKDKRSDYMSKALKVRDEARSAQQTAEERALKYDNRGWFGNLIDLPRGGSEARAERMAEGAARHAQAADEAQRRYMILNKDRIRSRVPVKYDSAQKYFQTVKR